MRLRAVSMLVSFALWMCGPERVSAQGKPPVPPNGTGAVTVTLRSEKPKTRLAVLPEYPPEDSEDDPPIKVCENDCGLQLPPGIYRVEVSGPAGSDIRDGTMTFMVDRDSNVSVEPTSRKSHARGLGIGVTGTTIAGVATAMTLLGLFINYAAECLENCQNDTAESRDRHALAIAGVGGAVVLVGAAMATVGFAISARNRLPLVRVEVASRKPTAVDNLRFAPVRMRTGWGMVGETRF
jgi:hypothetical protein